MLGMMTLSHARYDDPAEVCRELAVTTLTGLMQVWTEGYKQRGDEDVVPEGDVKHCEE